MDQDEMVNSPMSSVMSISSKLSIDNPPLLDKYNEKLSHWNEKIEQTAKEIGDMSKSYKLMHINTAQRADYNYNKYMYLSLTLGPATGMLSGCSLFTEEDIKQIFLIIVTFLSFFAGIISAIIKFSKFDEETTSNKLAAARYTSLESNVRRQLTLYRKDRVPAVEYIEWLNKSFEELFMASPLVPEDIFNKYAKKAKKIGIIVPKKYEKTIKINEKYQTQKIFEITNDDDINVNTEEEQKFIEKAEEPIKGEKIIKRTKTMSQYPFLGEFDDKLMNYEMRRFMGIR
jgi:hypothetical protein